MREGLEDVVAAMHRLPGLTAAEAVTALRDEAGYGAYLEQKRMDSGKLSILGLLAEQEPTPDRLLARLAELREVLAHRQDPAQALLTLSTIHSSKGLEYDSVVLLDVFDGILPAQLEVCCRTKEDTLRYEEDRRLYYVAMTRPSGGWCSLTARRCLRCSPRRCSSTCRRPVPGGSRRPKKPPGCGIRPTNCWPAPPPRPRPPSCRRWTWGSCPGWGPPSNTRYSAWVLSPR